MLTGRSEPRLRVVWTDPVSGRRGYAVIDSWVAGRTAGGTRMREGVTLQEVERLARAMTNKSSAFNIPSGGAKGGVDVDPHDPQARAILSRYVKAMRPLYQSGWATTEDMGVSQELLDEVFAERGLGLSVHAALARSGDPAGSRRRIIQGMALRVEGIPLPDCIGGYGVAEAAAAAAAHQGWQLRDMRAVVQGFGSMGGSSARYLARHGVRVVAAVDVRGAVVNPDGLDVETLLRSRGPFGEIDRAALRPGDRELPREEWLDVEAEIAVPAAVADAIDADDASRVRASLIVEAANIPTTDEAQRRLHDRGVVVVPDYIANAGAVFWWWLTILGELPIDARGAFDRLSVAMRTATTDVLSAAAERGVTPRTAADDLAMRNLERMIEQHGEEDPLPAPAPVS